MVRGGTVNLFFTDVHGAAISAYRLTAAIQLNFCDLIVFHYSIDMHHSNKLFSELLNTIRQLLGENGCPWDRRQTNETLQKHLTSEMDELIQAIRNRDPENLCEELGDLLYLILLLSDINSRNGQFSIDDVMETINKKLIRRHPHVFADAVCNSDEELRKQWLAIKAQEKAEKLI